MTELDRQDRTERLKEVAGHISALLQCADLLEDSDTPPGVVTDGMVFLGAILYEALAALDG